MSAYPREFLAAQTGADIQSALGRLSWAAISSRISTMDETAIGGVSADATLVASLVKRCCDLATEGSA
jgi:hypothetical protein